MKTLQEFSVWLESEKPNKIPFNFKEFSEIRERPKALRYLVTSSLKLLGSGTFRATFKLDENKVIKIATMIDGIEHNINEQKNSKCLGSDYAVTIYDAHPENWWLIEERAEILEEGPFISLFFTKLGIDQRNYPFVDEMFIRKAIEYAATNKIVYNSEINTLIKTNQYWLKTSKWYKEFIEKIQVCSVGADDFTSNNWGVRPNSGELILIDLGF
jgi:hypothetical protein